MSATASVSVVIPAYNEAACLADTLHRVSSHLAQRDSAYEVLVVDDGSSDETARIADEHPDPSTRAVRQERNLGKGAAVRRGVAESTGQRILLCDADLSTPISELDRLEEHGGGAPLVLGSRRAPGAKIVRTRARRIVSWLFNTTLHALGLCRGLRDTQCGFKLLDGEVARDLFPRLELDGFAFDLELIELARHEGLEVREVGIEWNDAGESTVRPFHHGLEMLADAFAVKRRMRQLRRG